jgi:glucose-1-phosphate thymidylyltransferase
LLVVPVHAQTALILATANPLVAAAPAPLELPFLLPIANRPLLFHLIDDLVAAGMRRLVIGAPPVALLQLRAVGLDRERWDADLRFLVVPERADPVRAIAGAHTEGALDGGPFVLHLADCRQRGVALQPPPGASLRADARLFVSEEGGDVVPLPAPGDAVAARARWQPPPRHRLTGVQVLGPAALGAARELADELTGAIGIARLADRVAERGGHVETVAVDDCWRYSGMIDDLLGENRRVLSQIEHSVDPASLVDSTVHGVAAIHPTAQLASTLVRGPVVIGAHAELSDAYIGPYTAIGPGAVVRGTEVENSIVVAGARLRHVGLRLEASVIGRDAEVMRDFRLPRALHLWVGDRARIVLS